MSKERAGPVVCKERVVRPQSTHAQSETPTERKSYQLGQRVVVRLFVLVFV